MANNSVSSVYRYVIDDVITNVRGDFEDMGIDEAVLSELQRLWENKVGRAGFVPEDGGYDGDEGNFEPSASTLQYQPTATDRAAAASLASLATANASILKADPDAPHNAGKPLPFLHPPPSRGNIPQTDGASDLTRDEIDALIERAIMQGRTADTPSSSFASEVTLELTLPEISLATARRALSKHGRGRQVDGNEDEEDGEGDEPINSDLDDSDDEGNQDSAEESGGDIILCLYDKVTRTKNKWKCVLKDGIMSVHGRDYVFAKANGDFEW